MVLESSQRNHLAGCREKGRYAILSADLRPRKGAACGGALKIPSLRLLATPGGRAALTEDDALYLEIQGLRGACCEGMRL